MDENDRTDLLRHVYRELIARGDDGTFNQEDAGALLAVCSELGSMGYVLTDDQSDWYKITNYREVLTPDENN